MPVEPFAPESVKVPDVSVVIPVYNAADYLRETLDSVLAQDIGIDRLELLAVDDGSSDDSLDILREYEMRHGQIRVHTMPNSGSSAAPRNLGLVRATGRYVYFVDSDDVLEPDLLRTAVEVADRTGNKIVLLKMDTFGLVGRKAPHAAFQESHFDADFIDSGAFRTLSALKLFDRGFLLEHQIRFPEGHRIGEDRTFALRAYLRAPNVSVVSDKVYYWIRNREDRSNLTVLGQPIHEEILNIRNHLEAIVSGRLSGNRLTTLLHRPILGRSGLRMVFGKAFLAQLEPDERRSVMEEFHALVAPHANDVARDLGDAEAQIIFDLVVAADLQGLETLSAELSEQPDPILVPASAGTDLVYRTPTGTEIRDLRWGVVNELLQLEVALTHITAKLEVGARGARVAPESVRFLWRHRKIGVEIDAQIELTSAFDSPSGVRQIGSASIALGALEAPGMWDAFVDLRWGTQTFRRRFGASRSKGISTVSRSVGEPPHAVMYFTEHGNITIDQGPLGAHPGAEPVPGTPEISITVIKRTRMLSIAHMPASIASVIVTGSGRTAEICPLPTVSGVVLAEIPKWADQVQLTDHAETAIWSSPLS